MSDEDIALNNYSSSKNSILAFDAPEDIYKKTWIEKKRYK